MASRRTAVALERLAALTPTQIVQELDRYIVGQRAAKKAVAIALRNRWRRQQAPESIRDEISANNIILIGPTGVGKTEIARRLARLSGAPFIKVEASKFTEVGYVGRDVESMIRDLVENAMGLVRAERETELEGLAREKVEERLLDLLLPLPAGSPPPRDAEREGKEGSVFVVSPTGSVQQEREDAGVRDRHQRTRDKLRQLLRDGQLESRDVDVEVELPGPTVLGAVTPQGAPEGMDSIGDMLKGMMPRRTRRRTMTVAEARRVLQEQEVDKLIDTDDLATEAIDRVERMGIVFLDEIDKIASGKGDTSGPDVSRQGVQRDLLPIVEGSTVQTRRGMVKTDHVLFIAAGAFHVARPSDLIPELQGRFPIRVELTALTEDDFVRIMTEPENALTRQYAALVAAEGTELVFEDDGIREIARIATVANVRMENIGARRLHTVMTTLLEDVLFDLPERGEKLVRVTADLVRERLKTVLDDEDLRRYIL